MRFDKLLKILRFRTRLHNQLCREVAKMSRYNKDRIKQLSLRLYGHEKD